MLAGAARNEKGSKGGGGRARLPDVDTGRLLGLKFKLICHFKLAVDMDGMASGSMFSPGFICYSDVYRH